MPTFAPDKIVEQLNAQLWMLYGMLFLLPFGADQSLVYLKFFTEDSTISAPWIGALLLALGCSQFLVLSDDARSRIGTTWWKHAPLVAFRFHTISWIRNIHVCHVRIIFIVLAVGFWTGMSVYYYRSIHIAGVVFPSLFVTRYLLPTCRILATHTREEKHANGFQ